MKPTSTFERGTASRLMRGGLSVALLATALAVSPPSVAQISKCRLLKIVDWPVTFAGSHIVVNGAINGQKVGIILDTGAERSIILRSSAERFKLPTQEARGYRLYGVGGESKVDIATVDEFKLGDAGNTKMRLFVSGERDLGDGVDVLLGEDFFLNSDVEFDLANRAVRLFQPKDCGNVSLAYWTKEVVGEVEIDRVNEERPRITFMVQINGKPVEAFLDSGAATSILSLEDAAAVGVVPGGPGVAVASRGGGIGTKTVEIWSGPFQSFAIGNEKIPDVRIHFADLFRDARHNEIGSNIARRVFASSMILGADFLRAHRTLVSHSQRRIYFTYVGGPVFSAEPAPTK